MLRHSADHLLDRELDAATSGRITALVLQDPRISGVHQLRTRTSGVVAAIQMHVDLDPNLTLEAAHAILIEAENRILAEIPAADILIHADPRGRAQPHGGAFAEPATAVPQAG